MATQAYLKDSYVDCSLFGLAEDCKIRQFLQPFALVQKNEKIHIGGKQGMDWIVDSLDISLPHFINAVRNIGTRPAAIGQLNRDLHCQDPLTAYYGSTCAKVTRVATPNRDMNTYRREHAWREEDLRALRGEHSIGKREINGVVHCFDSETLQDRPCPE